MYKPYTQYTYVKKSELLISQTNQNTVLSELFTYEGPHNTQ